MEKRINGLNWILILVFSVGIFSTEDVFSGDYILDKDNSEIKCNINYSLIGKYRPVFEEFEANIFFNKDDLDSSFVEIVINIDSIKSKYPTLDRLARSSRLMDSAKYNTAIFKGEKIKKAEAPGEYYVDGSFDFHGVKRDLSFNFYLRQIDMKGPYHKGKEFLEINGSWKINRKEFDIIWHDVLDKGGIIVSDQVLIDW
ncbi:MAG: YceI family protein, partial [Candidatus Omnitrophica bacterium]|nr:YceI family protein [Candidatus Omnitrophota bacterium]